MPNGYDKQTALAGAIRTAWRNGFD